ncbi:MAG: hypothetical protein AB8C02_12685 [Halioglobus sp.]
MGVSTIVFLLIGAGFTATVLLVLYRNLQSTGPTNPGNRLPRASSPQAQKRSVTSPGSPFRAVSVTPGPKACAAVKGLKGQFYLVELGDAPELPLPACDVSKCGCRYNHHSDRRSSEEDRRVFASLRTDLHEQNGNKEQRKTKSRRATD